MDAYDLIVVGGGINGVGIARDAAGRGLSVLLVEQHDLAAHTSSASTKLVHGGLRYLEYYAFRLVRESLAERERLLALAPHIIRPMRFVLPQPPGGRPGWMIRLGLFLYDHIGGRRHLPPSRSVSLSGGPLKPEVRRGFEYSDCWVDDARLAVLNAIDAAARGARILTRTRFVGAQRVGDRWAATIADRQGERAVAGRAIVNAAGPWVAGVLQAAEGAAAERPPRLVRGSHIIVPQIFEGPRAYILQNPDGRIVFAIPYEGRFTLIGTTDVQHDGDPGTPAITAEETDYLCRSVSRYFARPVTAGEVVRSYSGVRPLYDDGREDAASVTRDYVLRLGFDDGPQLLSVFGGKITTYRKLAEHALDKLKPYLPAMTGQWTGAVPLPGGRVASLESFLEEKKADWPWLPLETLERLVRQHGTRITDLISESGCLADMGEQFGAGLSAREVDWLVAEEWARTAEDVLWRRTKIGLHIDPEGAARVARYLEGRHG